MLHICHILLFVGHLMYMRLIPPLRFHLEALQTSLLFSKDYGLLSFLRKSLASDEVGKRKVEQ